MWKIRPGLSRVSEKNQVQWIPFDPNLYKQDDQVARSGNGSGTLILTEGSLPPASFERVTLTIKNWYVDFNNRKKKNKNKKSKGKKRKEKKIEKKKKSYPEKKYSVEIIEIIL